MSTVTHIETGIIEASKSQDLAKLDQVLEQGVQRKKAFLKACRFGDLKQTELLLDEGAKINGVDVQVLL